MEAGSNHAGRGFGGILVNARAGRRGERTAERLKRLLDAASLQAPVYGIDPAALGTEIDLILPHRPEVIGVAGGDGSLATAAGCLAGTETALLPIPAGTLNHFARRAGIADLPTAIQTLTSGRIDTMSVGLVDDRIFLNTATFGLYADVVRRRERLRKLFGKWPAAAIAFVDAIRRLPRIDLVVQVEGEYIRRSTPLIWVGIGWGSFPRVLEAAERRRSPDLEIVVLKPGSRFGSVALLSRLVRHLLRGRRPISDPALEILHARSLLIHAPFPIEMTMDGETYTCDAPLFVGVQDHALRVVVPSDMDRGSGEGS